MAEFLHVGDEGGDFGFGEGFDDLILPGFRVIGEDDSALGEVFGQLQ